MNELEETEPIVFDRTYKRANVMVTRDVSMGRIIKKRTYGGQIASVGSFPVDKTRRSCWGLCNTNCARRLSSFLSDVLCQDATPGLRFAIVPDE